MGCKSGLRCKVSKEGSRFCRAELGRQKPGGGKAGNQALCAVAERGAHGG
jgi:hypothetical protein